MKKGTTSFDLICRRHGSFNCKRANQPVVGVKRRPKRKRRCPLCIKEYCKRHNITNASGIDWRYVDLDS